MHIEVCFHACRVWYVVFIILLDSGSAIISNRHTQQYKNVWVSQPSVKCLASNIALECRWSESQKDTRKLCVRSGDVKYSVSRSPRIMQRGTVGWLKLLTGQEVSGGGRGRITIRHLLEEQRNDKRPRLD